MKTRSNPARGGRRRLLVWLIGIAGLLTLALPVPVAMAATQSTSRGPVAALSAAAPNGRQAEQRGSVSGFDAAMSQSDLTDSPALVALTSCLSGNKLGDLILLIDTSGSLGGDDATDPAAIRVDAAQTLVAGLAGSLAVAGAQVDVSIAGFDDDVTQVVDFTPLASDQLAGLDGALKQFASMDRGSETDYWSALTWVNRTFAARAQARGGDPRAACQFVVWFSDGEFTIGARDGSDLGRLEPPSSEFKDVPGYETTPLTDKTIADQVKAAAMAELCRPGGVADQMRLAGVTMIGIGLGGGDADTRFDFMRKYSENNPQDPCGAQPGNGVFLAAGSVGQLFLILDGIGRLNGGTQSGQLAACPLTACPTGSYKFQLDNTLGTVHLAAAFNDASGAALGSSGLRIELSGPSGGEPLVITGDGTAVDGTAAIPQTTATYRWFPGGDLTVDLKQTQDWAGEWTLTFIDTTGTHPDAVSHVQVTLTSDFQVVPTLPSGGQWRAGEDSGPIVFLPEHLDGSPATVQDLPPGQATTATIEFPDGTTSDLPPVALGQPTSVPIPENSELGAGSVHVVLNISLAGQQLSPVQRDVAFEVQAPLGTPNVTPGQVLSFGHIDGVQTVSASLTVTGPEVGDGCVAIAGVTLPVRPPKVDGATIIPSQGSPTCQPVPQGQTVQLPLSLTPGAEGNGPLEGDVDVRLSAAGNPDKVSIAPVHFTATMTRLPQETVKTWVLIGVLLLGLLIPVLIGLLVRRMTARFPTGEQVALQAVLIDVRIGPSELSAADGSALSVPPAPWTPLAPPGAGRRSLLVAGVPLRARAGWRLTEPGYAQVDSGDVGACGSPPHLGPGGSPRMPLAVQGTWTLLVPRQLALSPLSPLPGRLLLVLDSAADESTRARLLSVALRDGPEQFGAARAQAIDATPPQDGGAPPTPPLEPAAALPGFGQQSGPDAGFGQPGATSGWPAPGSAGGFDATPPESWGRRTPPPAAGPRGDGWT